MEAIVRSRHGRILSSQATDALGRRVEAAFGMLEGGKEAVVEQAQASGLWRLAEGERDAGRRDQPRDRRADRGRDRERCARGARDGRRQRDQRRRPRSARGARRHTSPRAAPTSASCVGTCAACASASHVTCAIRSWAQRARRTSSPPRRARHRRRSSGSSAVYGRGRGLRAGRPAATRRPSRWQARAAAWPAGCGRSRAPSCVRAPPSCSTPSASTLRCATAFAVVTGEGRLDEQTLGGKTVFEVATRARQAGVPCYAVVGRDDLDAFGRRLMNLEVESASVNGAGGGRGAASGPPVDLDLRSASERTIAS